MTPADQAADWVGSDRKYIAITLGGNTRNSLFLSPPLALTNADGGNSAPAASS
jgi:hypothetical protein